MSYNTSIRITLKNINKVKVGTIFLEVVFIHDITKQKVRRYISTNQRIHSDDIVRGRIKQIDRTKSIRQIVDKKRFEQVEKLRLLQIQHDEISPEIYDASISKSDYDRYTLVELIDVFIRNKSGLLEERTIQKYNTLKSLIEKFQVEQKRKPLYPSNIDQKFYTDFTRYLTVDKKHAVSTVNKYQATFKAFLHYVNTDLKISQKFEPKEFKKASKSSVGGAKVVLLKEHVDKLMNWKPTSERYEIIRDLFIFQILTGLRFSDLERVNKSFVINNSLSFFMYKTEDRVNIPLHPGASKILLKYNYELGKICGVSQKYNADLKVVCEEAGLTDTISQLKIKLNRKISEETPLCKLVSSHVGRSTFITNCLVAGISPFIVMAYTGHKDIDTLAIYMRLAGDMERDAFKKFENYFKF